MNKCQHAEKITRFCISEHCQARQGGACEQCLRKYHLHPPSILLEQDLHALIKKFTMDSSVKPKCRLLQQSIFNYFNQIKTELGNSLDTACKNIINQIGYPFLYSQGILSTFKRLKSKEYRRLPQKDIKAFVEIAGKIGEKDSAREESSIYSVEVRDIHEVVLQLEALLKSYELLIKRYHSAPVHQGYYPQKLMEVFKGIVTEPPGRNVKNNYEQESKSKGKNHKANLSTSYTNNTKLDMKTFEAKAIELKNKVERVEAEIEPMIASPNMLGLPKTQKIRDVSLDRKINKDVKSTPRESQIQQKIKESHVAQIKTPIQNLQHVKLELNNRQMGLNHKKKLLMDIMKTNEKTDRQAFQKMQSIELATLRSKLDDYSHPRKERFSTDTKSVNESEKSMSSEDLAVLDDQHVRTQEDQKIYAFSKLPVEEICKKPVEKQEVKKKLIVIRTEFKSKDSKGNQMDSPLFKKHRIQNNFEQIKLKEAHNGKDSPKKLEIEPKQVKEVKQVLQLKENEQKSLALLLTSLAMNAQQAIQYLQSSLKYAENNLSAAEYLSYLYLELNRPKDCLVLCNRYLERMQHSREIEELSINLSNNKAAALNILGRYSQAIMIVEQCLKYKEKDTLYKNLGDSYFSIGIYDKAIGNYQKSIKLNPNNQECYYNLAASLFIQQSYQAAKTAIRKALQANPKSECYLELESHIQAKGKSI